jgi:hypothetical protein
MRVSTHEAGEDMIQNPQWLVPAYLANIAILVPVCHAMFLGGGVSTVFEGKVAESAGLRLLVGSLWMAILVASIAGLRWQAFFAPLLVVQIIYKATWLTVFVLPFWLNGQPIPAGISIVFAAIVIAYPVLLWMAWR